ncbi:MAG: serine/threonine protein kinase, partial [Myxococcales bacterium]|nr:serine/threonine protein kinase [Myxococcales bacterium]
TRTPPTALFQPGEVIDKRFEVVRLLGAGGMGQVFVVKHVHLDRVLALKVLLPDLHAAPGVHERFRREALAASKLRHDNVVEVHDSGILADGTPYYTMELLEGEDLAATLAREGPLPWARVRKLSLHICRAIVLAHERGVIHRDIKPANCFRMTRDGDPDHIKVLDFGIAKLVEKDSEVQTRTGGVLGTPHYMSPEQAQGFKDLGGAADIWSMGVLMYECLAGMRPFEAESMPALLLQICTFDPLPLAERAATVHPAFARV